MDIGASESSPEVVVRLSIIVPTPGRPTVNRAIASATSQMLPGDELIVCYDASGDWGSTPRNRAIEAATGTHLTFLDDDDVYLPGALEKIRIFARRYPNRIGIFQMHRGLYGVVWTAPDPTLVTTASGMFVVPNLPGKVGRFGRMPGVDAESPAGLYPFAVGDRAERLGDGRFIIESVALQREPIWCPVVIQDVRPESSWFKRTRYRMKLRTRFKRMFGLSAPDPTGPIPVYPGAVKWAREMLKLD